jgi:beta-1,4-mannosyl-glycoprotein beta-1,4-N-acetylglucosaminyltransferase
MKIYDTFIFSNELDLLDLRLNTLNDYIDKFVIVESNITFSGKPKRLYFSENKDYFKKFEDKIIHVVVENPPDSYYNEVLFDDPKNQNEIIKNKIYSNLTSVENWSRDNNVWGREHYQRESIFLGLTNCADDDIILISDVDEFPHPDSLCELIKMNENDIFEFRHKFFYYKLNLLKSDYITGTKSIKYKSLKNNTIYKIRKNHNIVTKIIDMHGWHLSFMGGIDRIKTKIESYSHQEFNNEYIKNNISTNMTNKKDLFFREGDLIEIDINDVYTPNFIELVKQKYSYLL